MVNAMFAELCGRWGGYNPILKFFGRLQLSLGNPKKKEKKDDQ